MNIRGILIDPWRRKITEVQCTAERTLDDMYKFCHCDCIDRVEWPDESKKSDVWVDDEGLLHDPYPALFNIVGYDEQSFAGRGLVLGYSRSGESVSTKLTIPEVSKLIRWELWEVRIPIDEAIRINKENRIKYNQQ
jgi:hypothetical protein